MPPNKPAQLHARRTQSRIKVKSGARPWSGKIPNVQAHMDVQCMLPALCASDLLPNLKALMYNVQAVRKKPALRHTLWRPPLSCAKPTSSLGSRSKASPSTPMPE